MKQSNNSQSNPNDKEYVKQRLVANTIIIVAVVAVIGFIATLIINQPQPSTDTSNSPGLMGDRGNEDPTPAQLEEGANTNRSLSGKNYLKGDGSVDHEAVNDLKEKLGNGGMKQTVLDKLRSQLDEDVINEVITSAQAKAIKQAFGME